MAKRSRRRAAQPKRENFGCMRGLISFFDFRRGHHAQKLLSDKKKGNSGRSRIKLDSLRTFHDKHGVNLVDEIREDQVNLCVTRVKALIEAEISQDHKMEVASDKAQRVTSNVQNGIRPKKTSQKESKKLSVDSDRQVTKQVHSLSLDAHSSDNIDFPERLSLKFDLAAFLIELYSYTCQEFHSDSSNKFTCLPTSGSIGTNICNHLDEIDDHLDQKISLFQQILADVAQAVVGQNSMVENQLNKQCIVHSTEFMNALDTLNSDKELFMKLLQDPNSLLLKHIQGLQCSPVGKLPKQESDKCLGDPQKSREDNDSHGIFDESDGNQLFQKQNRCTFFGKKDKTKPSGECTSSEDPVRIVILKPSSARNQNSSITSTSGFSPQSHHVLVHSKEREKNASHFSLKEIKRRLQRVIGESRRAQKLISMDGICHKIPVKSNKSMDTCESISNESSAASSTTDPYCRTKSLPHSLSIDNWKFQKIISEECQVRIRDHISSSSRSESFTYEEAKKHLSELLDAGVNSLPRVHISQSLERVISLPRYIELYPSTSPRMAKEPTMLHPKTGHRSLEHLPKEDITATLSALPTNLELSSCSLHIPSDESELLIVKPEPADNSMHKKSCIAEDSISKGSTEFEGVVVTKNIVEHNEFDVPLESSGNDLTITDEMNENYKEEYGVLQGLNSSEEESQKMTKSTFPPSSLKGEILVASESTTERPESVLETFLSEAITSPESDAGEKIPRRLHFEDHDNHPRITASPDMKEKSTIYLTDTRARSSYIETILEASGLTDKFPERWEMDDQLLEPSLFDEMEAFFCFLQDDAKLLFDCINEVLAEINEKFLKSTPRLSFINQKLLPAPRGERLIQEVTGGVEQHLRLLLPNTLNQLISKDLNCRSWMDLQGETANVTGEMCESILDDLLEETIYDLWF